MAFNLKTLNNQTLLRKLTVAQQNSVKAAATEITLLRHQLKDKNTLKNNASVKALIKAQLDPVNKKNKTLTANNKKLQDRLASETKLKTNPVVKKIISKETDPLNRNIQKLMLERESLRTKLKALGTVKRLPKKSFNKFIADSVRDLQKSLQTSDAESEGEFIIRDVEIEATVLTEEVNGQPEFSLPTREDLKELSGERLQKLKYSLVHVPRDIGD